MSPHVSVEPKRTVFTRSTIDGAAFRPIGVFVSGTHVSLLLQNNKTSQTAHVAQSKDGFSFAQIGKPVYFTSNNGEQQYASASHFSSSRQSHFLLQHQTDVARQTTIGLLSKSTIIPVGMVDCTGEFGVIVSNYRFKKQHVLYFGERAIHCAYSTNLMHWQTSNGQPLIVNAHPLEVGGAWKTEHGILLLYFKKEIERSRIMHDAHLALFDANDPSRIVWKTSEPVLRQRDYWPADAIRHVGTVLFNKRLLSYWQVNDHITYGVYVAGFTFDPASILRLKTRVALKKHIDNPIIKPNPDNEWEAFNTFNPAAIYADQKVHILYRAQGFDYISSVGYASSRNGITIDERLDKPVYKPVIEFEHNPSDKVNHDFVSGGGYGGCEDPRATCIDGRVYMTYVAFDGWSPPRLAMTSILLDNFLTKRWLWSKPVLISPPGIIDKSGCLFPEKINGKYVFLHRVFPNILIDFVDDLAFGSGKWLRGQYAIKVRKNHWDSRKIGAGAPPIKTTSGWLLIYYGVDDRDASKYHVGVMLLDLHDPTNVLYRSEQPILEPSELYEYSGFKPGVAYPCGAVVVDDTLMVYYGAADSQVCVATASLTNFLADLKARKSLHFTPAAIREIAYS